MIAITGASGFIGTYIAERLPYPQKRLSRQASFSPSSSSQHHWIKGDLENSDDIQKLITNSSTLIHLACSSHPRSSNQDLSRDIQSNLISTIKLFEAYAKENPRGHIIYSSSGGNMYDVTPDNTPRTELDIPCPQSSYGIHKLAAENYLRLLCEMYEMRGTILRISNPYGIQLPRQRTQGLIGVAFAKLLSQEPIQIVDSLQSVRDYIHLADVASAFNLAIEKPPLVKECRLFNVSSGVGHTLTEVLNFIEKAVGHTFIRQIGSDKLPSPSFSVLSYNKIKDALGWIPRMSLNEGIHHMWTQSLTNK